MILKEFFGRPVNVTNSKKDDNVSFDVNELFHYILEDDVLHRTHFFPIAKKIKKFHNESKLNKKEIVKEFMPMVKEGCRSFYKNKNLFGNIQDRFNKELREEICEKLFDHFFEDIIKEKYTI